MSLRHLFPMHSNILLVPHWVVDSLHRHDLSIDDVLDLPKIKTILSMNDLLSLAAIQSFGEMVLGSRDIVAGATSVFCEWKTSCAGSKETEDFLERNIYPFENDAVTRESVKSRLFTTMPMSAKAEATIEVKPIQDIALAVVVYPGLFTEQTSPTLRLDLHRALLRQLYVYEEQSVVNATPLFRSYLGHLLRQS